MRPRLPPLANPGDPSLPAKEVFGRALTPTQLQARSIGFYARGCLAGAHGAAGRRRERGR